jgi:hypothetical protein
MPQFRTETSDQLLSREFGVLISQYGKAQQRCTDLLAEQAAEIERLRADQMRLRAAVIIRETALQFEREERARLEAAAPGLPRRALLARRIEELKTRIERLMRERLNWQWRNEEKAGCESCAAGSGTVVSLTTEARNDATVQLRPPCKDNGLAPSDDVALAGGAIQDEAILAKSLQDTDLVICQTGCVSHGDYWRVQDHCRRTGKACVLIDETKAIHIVRKGKGTVVQASAMEPQEFLRP